MQTTLLYIGGILLVVGAVLPILPDTEAFAAPIYAIGCTIYALVQIYQPYRGDNLVVKRLRRQQVISDVLLVVSALLMLCHTYGVGHIGSGEWKIVLLVAVVLQVYTAFRIPNVLEKSLKD